MFKKIYELIKLYWNDSKLTWYEKDEFEFLRKEEQIKNEMKKTFLYKVLHTIFQKIVSVLRILGNILDFFEKHTSIRILLQLTIVFILIVIFLKETIQF